jgi:hypothetical protein
LEVPISRRRVRPELRTRMEINAAVSGSRLRSLSPWCRWRASCSRPHSCSSSSWARRPASIVSIDGTSPGRWIPSRFLDPSSGRLDAPKSGQLLGVSHHADGPDQIVRHVQDERRDRLCPGGDDDAGLAVDGR